MWPLLICSILSWAVVMERTYFYLSTRRKLLTLIHNIDNYTKNGNKEQAKALADTTSQELKPLTHSLFKSFANREDLTRNIDRERMKLGMIFKKNLWVLGTVGSASPFIGLLGTVVGIVRAFHEMSAKGTGGVAVVSAGISEALVATAAGLIVAILALIFYNIFTSISNQTMTHLRFQLD